MNPPTQIFSHSTAESGSSSGLRDDDDRRLLDWLREERESEDDEPEEDDDEDEDEEFDLDLEGSLRTSSATSLATLGSVGFSAGAACVVASGTEEALIF